MLPVCWNVMPPETPVRHILETTVYQWGNRFYRIRSQPKIAQQRQSQALRPNWIVSKPWVPMSALEFSVQFSHSVMSDFATPWTAARQTSPVHHQLLELTQTHARWVGDAIQPFHPLSSPSPPAFNLSQLQGLFKWVSSLHQMASKYWSFSFSISPSNEHSGLILFRMDWLDLLAVQGTLKSLLQHHSSKASILWCSAFFTVQLSYPYMTTGKTTALTRWTFVGKVMSLLFNMLSRLVMTFLPRSKLLLISWLQSPSAVILETAPPPN